VSAERTSTHPQVAIYRAEGMLRHTIDCLPITDQPDVYLVEESIATSEGEAVVVPFNGADLRKVYSREEMRAIEAREWRADAQEVAGVGRPTRRGGLRSRRLFAVWEGLGLPKSRRPG
jgi:hypothetical protein